MIFVKYGSMFRGDSHVKTAPVRLNQKLAILILGGFCLAGGIFGVQFIKLLFNINISVSLDGYVRKAIVYMISLIIGWFFYTYLYSKIGLFKKIREIELTFNQICFSIVLFFAGMFSYLLYIIWWDSLLHLYSVHYIIINFTSTYSVPHIIMDLTRPIFWVLYSDISNCTYILCLI